MSCALGVLSAPDSNEKDTFALTQFGENVGIVFQLIDDLIGVIGDPKLTGKSVGNDLRKAKKHYRFWLYKLVTAPEGKRS